MAENEEILPTVRIPLHYGKSMAGWLVHTECHCHQSIRR